jgi:DNA-binding transcriptional regulator YdaS (Cro superfamily)
MAPCYRDVMHLKAFVSVSRGRGAQLARAIGVHPVLVSQWAGGKREVPIEHCAAIEAATQGGVTRQELRPQDWPRIWPELVGLGACQRPAVQLPAATEAA